MSTRKTNLPYAITFQFYVTTSGTPEQLAAKLRAATIAFNDNGAAADTITDSNSGFLVAGFQSGDQITVSGASNSGNNATFTIATVTAGTITLVPNNALTTEAAGSTVKLVAPKTIPDGISLNIKTRKANTGNITVGYSSETALNTALSNILLAANESIGLQVISTNKVWIDSTVSGEGVEIWFEKNELQTA